MYRLNTIDPIHATTPVPMSKNPAPPSLPEVGRLYTYDGGMFEVAGVEGDKVRIAPQGGGFVRAVPLERFQQHFKPCEIPGFSPAMASADFLDGAASLPCFMNGARWNGWAMPYFEHATALKLCEAIPDLSYEESTDVFTLSGEDIDEPEVFAAEHIEVNGSMVKVYGIGAGSWCWDAEPAQEGDAPSAPQER